MKSISLLALALATTSLASLHPRQNDTTLPPPKNWAVALFNAFDSIDALAPLDPLYYLAFSQQLNLYLLADTLSPIHIQPANPSLNRFNSSFWYSINPTHTYASAPSDIEVLLVPGGPAVRLNDLGITVDFVRNTYPKLRYLISVCTGSGILAQAGVLDGRRATTNKKAWASITAMGVGVEWVSPARWVVDGNIWSASGVTSSLDLIFAFIEEVYGEDAARNLQSITEFDRVKGPCDDPFAEINGVPPTGRCEV